MKAIALALFVTWALGCGGSSGPAAADKDAGGGGGDSGGGGSGGGSGGGGSGGSGNSDAVLGSFLLNLETKDPAHTTFLGVVKDGPQPELIIWDDVASGGGCTLQAPRVPFCTPSCTNGLACVAGGQCVGYPAAQDVGTVTVKGIGSADLVINPQSSPATRSVNYQPTGDLPYPPADEGASIEVDATGGKLGPFTIKSTGIAPLAFAGPIPLESGKSLSLTWTAPGMPALTHMQIKVDISHHGGTRGQILCDVPDDGALEIPEPLITKLISFGVAGFPSVTLSRVAIGWASVPGGRISLEVSSTTQVNVTIPGLISCTDTSDCPMGKTCQPDQSCR
ncbi:MAG TPA: hypothetical protein VNO55_18920 [Polyangia bacterium]|nr:hypothetical protein [Polyangia bacterium]